jgi:hypothetical protein
MTNEKKKYNKYIKEWHEAIGNNCGVYILYIGDKYYVGSSSNLYNRERVHRSKLKGNYHPNKALQQEYNQCNELEYRVLAVTETPGEALDLEKALIFFLKEHKECLSKN